jgi:mRNA-decapping enzyme subunit 2
LAQKIDWYKLTDLPTLRRKNQMQQGTGNDLIKENNFYMVAPFLGPLKGWIKQQQKLDKQKTRTGGPLQTPAAPAAVTDTEDIEADVGEMTADEGALPEMRPADENFAELVARLGRGGRSSDALPEVSVHQTQQVVDPAAELKRLLSVGSPYTQQSTPVEAPAPAQDPHSNSLLAMLQSSNRQHGQLPRTPYEQLMSPPQMPQTPQAHQPRAPQINHMSPPPPFPFQPQHHQSFPGPQHSQMYTQMPQQMSPQQFNGHPMQMPRQSMPPQPHHQNQMFPARGPNMQEPEAFSHQAPRPYQRTGDPQFAAGPQFSEPRGPIIPPASNLPPPKLNAHTMGLLNTFKMNEKPAASPPQQTVQPAQTTPRLQQPTALQLGYESRMSPQGLSTNLYAPSPPPFTSPPQHPNFETLQPKPRNAHHDSLLTLFRSPSVPAAPTPPPKSPAELSAQPKTPGYMNARPTSREPMPPQPDIGNKPDLLALFTAPAKKPTLTSATVSGPVNAPDFETVKKNTISGAANGQGHSRVPSPAGRKSVEQKMFIPQQILRRPSPSTSKPDSFDTGDVRRSRSPMAPANLPAPQPTAFKPQILRRPQQGASQASAPVTTHMPAPVLASQPRTLLDLFKTATPPPSAPQPPVPAPVSAPTPVLSSQPQALLNLFKTATPPPFKTATPPPSTSTPPAHFPASLAARQQSFDRRSPLPTEQKNALLSLFGKPSQGTTTSTPVVQSPLPLGDSTQSFLSSLPRSPIPPARSPHPPTPKTMMSGVISPVSPLPDKSQGGSPAHLASRSRISSIGEGMESSGNVLRGVLPTSHPSAALLNLTTKIGMEDGYASAGSAGPTEKFAVDKNLGKVSSSNGTGKSPVDKSFLLGFLEDVARRGR